MNLKFLSLCLFRQEDAQEFLSFVMDRMHAELLKLDGTSSSTNGGKSFVVASAEDDEWETVGRKNKTAVMRTQSFVPSELSEIFGGQLTSMVKAKGSISFTIHMHESPGFLVWFCFAFAF